MHIVFQQKTSRFIFVNNLGPNFVLITEQQYNVMSYIQPDAQLQASCSLDIFAGLESIFFAAQ